MNYFKLPLSALFVVTSFNHFLYPLATMAPAAAVTEDQREVIAAQNEKTKGQTALQAISQSTSLPSIPTFADHEKHRVWILEFMASAFRVFSRKGFTEGMSCHISVRDTQFPPLFLDKTARKTLRFAQSERYDLT